MDFPPSVLSFQVSHVELLGVCVLPAFYIILVRRVLG